MSVNETTPGNSENGNFRIATDLIKSNREYIREGRMLLRVNDQFHVEIAAGTARNS